MNHVNRNTAEDLALARMIDARDVVTMIRAEHLTDEIERAYLEGRCIRCGSPQDYHATHPETACIRWAGGECSGYLGRRGEGPATTHSTELYEYDGERRMMRDVAASAREN